MLDEDGGDRYQLPTRTPDQVKTLLMSTAVPMSAVAQGAGELNVQAAIMAATPATVTQSFARALGIGSLDGARGTVHVADSESGVALLVGRAAGRRPGRGDRRA